MNRYPVNQSHDRIILSGSRPVSSRRPLVGRGQQLQAVGLWVVVILALGWTMIQLNQDSSAQTAALPGAKTTAPAGGKSNGALSRASTQDQAKAAGAESAAEKVPQAQGPALIVPDEVVAMFQQRQEELERREKAVRTSEERLTVLKAELEQVLSKVEAAEQRRLLLKAKQDKATAEQSAVQNKQAAELRTQQHAQLTKIYETMPSEEAAARIEQMADRKALEILRLLKGKTAGSILAQMNVDRAAQLSEQLLSAP